MTHLFALRPTARQATRRPFRPRIDALEGRTLLTAGTLDTTFGGTGMVTTLIQNGVSGSLGTAVQSDLKVVVVRETYRSGGGEQIAVARYNPDGSLDTSFGTNGTVVVPLAANDDAQAVAIQPADGKIVVVGNAYVAGKKGLATGDWAVVRLNPNGSLDTTFGGAGYVLTQFTAPSNPAHDSYGTTVVLQGDGKIVAAGEAATATTSGIGLVRYNADGSLDTSFGAGGKVIAIGTAYGWPGQMAAIDSSGRILAVGNSTVGSTAEMTVTRYLANGTPGTSFGTSGVVNILPTGASAAIARSVGLQSTGQIVVYGQGNYPGVHNLVPTLVRLKPNGSLDTTFGSGGFYTDPRLDYGTSMLIQPADDKIVAVSNGWTGTTRDANFWVTRVLADGSSYDPTFGTNGLGEANFGATGGYPNSVALAPDTKIVVTGLYNNSAEFATARFHGDSASPTPARSLAALTGPQGATGTAVPEQGATVLDDVMFRDPLPISKHRHTS
jgi:uncharacterized delta-60 repeat protein